MRDEWGEETSLLPNYEYFIHPVSILTVNGLMQSKSSCGIYLMS